MKKSEIANKMSRAFYKVGFKIKKHSPEIFLVTGIAGGVVSAVMACKATTKVSKIIEEKNDAVEGVRKYEGDSQINSETGEEEIIYSKEDAKKDLVIIYTQTGIKLIKLYGPAILVGVASITSLLASNNIMRKRGAALMAAYTTLDTGFKEYRKRVADRFGDDVEREIRYNTQQRTIVDENGEEQTVEVAEKVSDGLYMVAFDENAGTWEPSPDINMCALRARQNWANDRLRARGYIFLNEIYEDLGLPMTKAGQVVGWIFDPKDPDCYVDFGIHETYRAIKGDPENGHERVILLNFNVQGDILHSGKLNLK